MSYAMGIPFDYNNKEYYEFVWFFERLVHARMEETEEAKQAENRMSLKNLKSSGMNMGQVL